MQIEIEDAGQFNLFDVIAAVAYGIEPLTRAERAPRFGHPGPDWFGALPMPAMRVISAVVRQFEKAGTEALETSELWSVDEVKREKGLVALRQCVGPRWTGWARHAARREAASRESVRKGPRRGTAGGRGQHAAGGLRAAVR